MFWKKTRDNGLEVEYETDRMSYRVVPDRNDPVILQANGKLVRVIDISAGGASCESDHLKVGQTYDARINLPDGFIDIRCKLEVLYRDPDHSYHCQFNDVDESGSDQLHRYVLQRQKTAIKAVKEKI
ncbi:MAG: PilZ domain-containing protein [Pseudomonadota bacterium]